MTKAFCPIIEQASRLIKRGGRGKMGRLVLVMWPKEFLSLLWVLGTSPVRWDDNKAGEEAVR